MKDIYGNNSSLTTTNNSRSNLPPLIAPNKGEPVLENPVITQENTEKPIDLEKKPKTKPTVQYYVKFSFMLTYILLMTTATVTFIEAIRTPYPAVRHVLNLETCISVVAGYFYSIFTGKIEEFSQKNIAIDWAEISKTRYIDWSITTPMMLLALCLVLGQNIKVPVKFSVIGIIVILNYIMLYVGYLGETNVLSRWTAMVAGFIPFFAMFAIIFYRFVRPKFDLANRYLFGVYLVVWSMYGLVYLLEENYKNIAMNVLDFTAKCLIGLGLWAYYTKTIVL